MARCSQALSRPAHTAPHHACSWSTRLRLPPAVAAMRVRTSRATWDQPRSCPTAEAPRSSSRCCACTTCQRRPVGVQLGPSLGAWGCQTLAVAAARGLVAALAALQGAVRPVAVLHDPSMAAQVCRFGFAVPESSSLLQRRDTAAIESRAARPTRRRQRSQRVGSQAGIPACGSIAGGVGCGASPYRAYTVSREARAR